MLCFTAVILLTFLLFVFRPTLIVLTPRTESAELRKNYRGTMNPSGWQHPTRNDTKRHHCWPMTRSTKDKKKPRRRRSLGDPLKPEQVRWIESRIGENGWNKEEFYAAYKTANIGKSLAQNPERQLQRIFQEVDPLPLTPLVKANLATTLRMNVEDFDAGLGASLGGKAGPKKATGQRTMPEPARQLAYTFFMDMTNRKVALSIDWENDTLSDVYASWKTFFDNSVALLKHFPVEQAVEARAVIQLLQEVLHQVLRPHLTRWQAAYRRWHETNNTRKEFRSLRPQEVQRHYPQFTALRSDFDTTQTKVSEYARKLEDLIYPKE
jgi:hypothetical protein